MGKVGRFLAMSDDEAETRARQERIKAEQRVGIKMELWRVQRVEERVS